MLVEMLIAEQNNTCFKVQHLKAHFLIFQVTMRDAPFCIGF